MKLQFIVLFSSVKKRRRQFSLEKNRKFSLEKNIKFSSEKNRKFSLEKSILSYFVFKALIVGTRKNCLSKVVAINTHFFFYFIFPTFTI